MAYSNSKTWISQTEAVHERWLAIESNFSRMRFDRSPFVPTTFQEMLKHQEGRWEDLADEERHRLENRTSRKRSGSRVHNQRSLVLFDGKIFNDSLSAVLALPTIWSPSVSDSEVCPLAPWPTLDEFREEGDERHCSGFGRFFPVPRVPGNETVAWKQKKFMIPHALDEVKPVPQRCGSQTSELSDELTKMWIGVADGFSENTITVIPASSNVQHKPDTSQDAQVGHFNKATEKRGAVWSELAPAHSNVFHSRMLMIV